MAKDIAEYCRTCDKCQQSKPPAPTPAPLQPFPIGRPWERVSIDILEIPMSRHGNKYLLVLQDSFTKWLEALPMKDQTATTVARKLTAVFCLFGIPETTLCYQNVMWVIEFTIGYDKQNNSREESESESDNNNRGKFFENFSIMPMGFKLTLLFDPNL
ncbi:Pol polyprotein [Trichinella sp. T9]|nr:Pol polyprotein [Trichinella sp. T9]